MTGDIPDFVARLRSVLPARWFPDASPILDALLTGVASSWSWLFGAVEFLRNQARIATATDAWLDAIALDYFGPGTCRRRGLGDQAYRDQIRSDLLRERGTRQALQTALRDLTGRVPLIFEPANSSDTGGYGSSGGRICGLAYGSAGGWGSLSLPFQAFVTAYRPLGAGIAMVSGFGGSSGGYGLGSLEYASLDMITGQVTDEDIEAAISAVAPAATICWTRISS